MKNYFVILFIFFMILIILGTADYFVSDQSFLQDYIRGSFTETVGIIITLIFVDYIFSRNDELERKKTELDDITRTFKILDVYIVTYRKYAYQVTTPLDQRRRQEKNSSNLELDFEFNEMRDLFEPSVDIMDDQDPVVLKLLDAQGSIKELIEEILLNVDFEFYSEFAELFTDYLKTINKYKLYDSITWAYNSYNEEGQRTSELISNLIKEHEGEVKFLEKNIINPYVALYYLIRYNLKFFRKYEKLCEEHGINSNVK